MIAVVPFLIVYAPDAYAAPITIPEPTGYPTTFGDGFTSLIYDNRSADISLHLDPRLLVPANNADKGELYTQRNTKILPHPELVPGQWLTFVFDHLTNNPASITKPSNVVGDHNILIIHSSGSFPPGRTYSHVLSGNTGTAPLLIDKEVRVSINSTAISSPKPFFFSTFENITQGHPIPECSATNFDSSTQTLKGNYKMCYGILNDYIVIITKRLGHFGVTTTLNAPSTPIDIHARTLSIPKPDNLEISTNHTLRTNTVDQSTNQTSFVVRDTNNEFVRSPVAFKNKPNGQVGDVYIPIFTRTVANPIFDASPPFSYQNTDCNVDVWSITELAKTNNVPSFTIPNNINPTNPNNIVGLALDFANVTSSCAVDMDAKSPNPLLTEKEMRFTIYNTINQPYYFSPRDSTTSAVQVPACTTDTIHLNNQTLKGTTKMCYGTNGDDIVIITKRIAFYAIAGAGTPDPSEPVSVELYIHSDGSARFNLGNNDNHTLNAYHQSHGSILLYNDTSISHPIFAASGDCTVGTSITVQGYSIGQKSSTSDPVLDVSLPTNVESGAKTIGLDFGLHAANSTRVETDAEQCLIDRLITPNYTNAPLITNNDMIITLDGQADQKAFFISNFQNITLAQPIAACTATNFDNSTKQLKGQALMCHISYGGDLIIATKQIGFYGATSGFTKLDGVLSLQKPPGPHRDHSLWISQDSSASTITFGSNKRYQIDFGGGPTLAHVNKPIGDIYISTGTKIKNDFFSPGNSRGSCFFGTYSIYYTSTQGGPGLPSNVFPTVTAGNPSGLTYRGVSNCANWSPPTPLIADKEMQISLYNKMAQKAWFSAPREGIHEAQPIPACTTDMIYPNNNTLKDGTTMCYGVNGTDMIIVTKRFQGSHGSANVINPPQTPVDLNPPPPPDPGSSSTTSLVPPQNFASLSPQFTAFGIIPRGASIGGDINVNTDTRFGPPNSKGDVVIQANTKVKPAALFDTDIGRPCISVNFRDPAILVTPPTVLRGADAMGFDLSTSTGLTPVCTIDPTTFNGTLLTDKELRITLYPNATTDTIAPHFFSQEQGNSATKPIPLCTSTNMHANQTLIGDTEMCYGTHDNNTIIISKRIGIYSANAPTGTIVPDPVSTPVNTVNGTISFTVSGAWTPGEQATVSISDADQNTNSAADDDQTISNAKSRIPTLITGDPHTLKDGDTDQIYAYTGRGSTWISFLQDPSQSYIHRLNYKTDDSHRGIISWTGGDLSNNAETLSLGGAGVGPMLAIPLGTLGDLRDSINDDDLNGTGNFTGRNLINYDFGSLTPNIRKSQLTIVNSAGTYLYSGVFASDDTRFPNHNAKSDILDITGFTVAHQTGTDYVLTGPDLLSQTNVNDNSQVLWIIEFSESLVLTEGIEYPIVLDFISYGFYGDGDSTDERIANQMAIAHFEPLSMYCTNKSNRSHSRLLYRHSISLRYSKNFFELTPRYFAKFNLAKPQNPSIPLM